MRLELNGTIISERPDEAAIAHSVAQMTTGGDVLALHRPPADFIQVEGTTAQGFTLNIYEDAQGTSFTNGSRKVDANSVTRIMSRFAAGSADWHDALQETEWQSGARQQEKAQGLGDIPGLVGLLALAIFGIPFVAWAAISGMIGETAPLAWGDVWKGLVAIVVIAAYVSWVDIFFRIVRPRMAIWLGKRLNANVVESQDVYDMGMWGTRDGKPLSRVLIFFLDIAIIVPGVVVPLAVPAVILLVIFNK